MTTLLDQGDSLSRHSPSPEPQLHGAGEVEYRPDASSCHGNPMCGDPAPRSEFSNPATISRRAIPGYQHDNTSNLSLTTGDAGQHTGAQSSTPLLYTLHNSMNKLNIHTDFSEQTLRSDRRRSRSIGAPIHKVSSQSVVLRRSYQFEYAAIARMNSRIAIRSVRHMLVRPAQGCSRVADQGPARKPAPGGS